MLLASVPSLSAAGWIDAVCAVLFVVAVVVGSVRGLTGELSRLFAFATALAIVALAYAPIKERAPASSPLPPRCFSRP